MFASASAFLRRFADGLVQLVFPGMCWFCRRLGDDIASGICMECEKKLKSDPHLTCPRCANSVGPHVVLDGGCSDCRDESLPFTHTFRMGSYDGLLRETILGMKRADGEVLAEVAAELWARHMRQRLADWRADVVVPVPLHWRRRWRRGFNQSDVLAAALGRELRLPVQHCLRRVRATAPQTQQASPKQRQANVHGAFAWRGAESITGKAVLLVDDVLTTGATASAAARVLVHHKPARIGVAVLARAGKA